MGYWNLALFSSNIVQGQWEIPVFIPGGEIGPVTLLDINA